MQKTNFVEFVLHCVLGLVSQNLTQIVFKVEIQNSITPSMIGINYQDCIPIETLDYKEGTKTFKPNYTSNLVPILKSFNYNQLRVKLQ